jgi:hypothetical protein
MDTEFAIRLLPTPMWPASIFTSDPVQDGLFDRVGERRNKIAELIHVQ